MPNLEPSPREAVAAFRLGIVGDLLARALDRGELRAELIARAQHRYRPPGSPTTRRYHWKTLQRWLYQARQGAQRLQPAPRDRGHALVLDNTQRETLLEIRRSFPSASAELILGEAVRNGVVANGQLSVSTLRRLFHDHDLSRTSLNRATRRALRRKWQADKVGQIWHSDVCHVTVTGLDGRRHAWRVHGLLDDFSRFCPRLEVRETEMERDLLEVFTTGLLGHPAPSVFFVDNGSCYSGNVLAAACQRLGIRLVHAAPYDPESRGKMERFWRTMRQQCTDHLGPVDGHGLAQALLAWLDAYHRRPHGGQMGRRPIVVYREGCRSLPAPLSDTALARALEMTVKRRVRKDGTLSVDGVVYEVGGWLGGKTIEVRVCGLSGTVLGARYQEQVVPVAPCDPVANSHRSRPQADEPQPRRDLPFNPVAGWLAAARAKENNNG